MSKVKLKTSHLYLEASLAASIFGQAAQVYTVFYPHNKSLLLAPMEDEFFPKLHKAQLQMLKTRNLQGDKSISLQEIIIDHDLDDTDRDLVYDYQVGANMLQVSLGE